MSRVTKFDLLIICFVYAGRGLNSEGGQARIRPTIQELLSTRLGEPVEHSPTPRNPGALTLPTGHLYKWLAGSQKEC